jgi:hypothetical protein
LGGFPADQVGGDQIDRYQRFLRDEAVSRYGRGFSEHSVFSYVASIGQVFRWAAHPDRRYVTVNPVGHCDKIKPTRRQVHIYRMDEVRSMLVRSAAIRARFAAINGPTGRVRRDGVLPGSVAGRGSGMNLRWGPISMPVL